METIISFGLYIATFIVGFFVDKKEPKNKLRKIYVIWLYIFLCFGYMTGSDWRGYEISFDEIDNFYSDKFLTEPGFIGLFYLSKILFKDFFLALGVLKCLYLFTLIKFLKEYTKHYILALTILLPLSSLFILIDNPLRFMTALTIVNLALIYFIKKKFIICYGLLIVAILFHSTTIFFILLPITIKYGDRLYSISSLAIIIIYIVIAFLSSNVELITNVLRSSIGFLLQYIEMKDYTQTYLANDNEAFFTLGSIMRIFIFVIIIFSKKFVNLNSEEERTFYGIAITYLMLERLLIIIPTGFRLAIPFGYYYALYLTLLVVKHSRLGYLVVTYLFLMMCKNIYMGYGYIPYSNSIPHILTQDYDSYAYRSNYNFEEYYKRFGHHVEQK